MSEKKKDAPPDPTKASHYVVQHPTDHHERGKVVEAVDSPAPDTDDWKKFQASYPSRDVLPRDGVPRLLALNAIRPATEDEVESGFVPMAPGVGGHPAPVGTQHPPAGTVYIDKQELAKLREQAAAGGDTAEVKKLRARIADLENDKARQMETTAKGQTPGRG